MRKICAWVDDIALRLGSLGHMHCAHAPWRSFQRVYALRSCSVEVVSAGICIALMLRGGRFSGYMHCAHAPWRSFQRVYALRLCSVKVVSHGIIIICCETTFKVAITRNAYTLLHPKGSETTSKVAITPKAYALFSFKGSGTTFHSPLRCKALSSTQKPLCY
jgi:hypothetical protein